MESSPPAESARCVHRRAAAAPLELSRSFHSENRHAVLRFALNQRQHVSRGYGFVENDHRSPNRVRAFGVRIFRVAESSYGRDMPNSITAFIQNGRAAGTWGPVGADIQTRWGKPAILWRADGPPA